MRGIQEKGGLYARKKRDESPSREWRMLTPLIKFAVPITKLSRDAGVGKRRRRSIWRGFHFRLAGTMDRRRFESRQVKLGRRWYENLRNIHFPARVVDSLQRLHFQFPASARYPGHGYGSKRTRERERENGRDK